MDFRWYRVSISTLRCSKPGSGYCQNTLGCAARNTLLESKVQDYLAAAAAAAAGSAAAAAGDLAADKRIAEAAAAAEVA